MCIIKERFGISALKYYDNVNKMTVVTNARNGKVITIRRGN